MRRLVCALTEEASLNPLGLAMAHGQIVMALRARIRATRLWSLYPEIRDRSVRNPLIILGQMRSGTTRLHRLLACDDRFAHTRLYESLSPVPLETRGLLDSRPLRAVIGTNILRGLNQEVAHIHPTSAMAAEEEFGLFSFAFGSAQFEAQWRIPGFVRWWEEQDSRWLYDEFRALLATIGWWRGDPEERPWLLKAPQFMQDLPAVLDAFPDARLIRITRNPVETAGSSASLVWNQMRIQSDNVEPCWVGREWLRKIRLRDDITTRALARHPEIPVFVTSFEAMNHDSRAEIDRLYGWLGLDLSPLLLRRMDRYLKRSTTHLRHRYSLEAFGLSPAEVERDCVAPHTC